ncbi:MAG: AEC family transporter [Alphaproteobacteria bacterium]
MTQIIDIVVPIFGFVVLGYVLGRSPVLTEAGAKGLTQFVIYCAVPALLFRAGTRLFGAEPLEPGLLVAFFGSAMSIYLVVLLLLWQGRGRPLAEAAMAATTCVFTNTVMLGLPLAFALYGDRGLLLTSSIIAVNGLIYYTLTTTLIELGLGQGQAGGTAKKVWGSLLGLTKNPILLGMALGLIWGALELPIPTPAAKMIDLLAAAAPPVALTALGASLVQFKLAGDLVEAGWLTIMKLVVYPSVTGVVGYYLVGLDGDTLALAILLSALPGGVNPFLIASRYGIYVARSGSAILMTTGISVLTLAILIALLEQILAHSAG